MIWDIMFGIVLGGTLLVWMFKPSFVDQKEIESIGNVIKYVGFFIVCAWTISYLERTYDFKLFGF